jgi:hypothetical protein
MVMHTSGKERAMFVRGTPRPWYLSLDTSEAIDFCFRVLQEDGLPVPPFDQHPDGDGSLRAAGMTAESWQAWLTDVLQLQRGYERTMQQWAREQPVPSLDERIWQPALAWSGNPAVRQRLQEWWEQYQQANRGLNKEIRNTLQMRHHTGQRPVNLWAALRPYHRRIPPLKVYYIHYPGGVDLVVPPDTVLLSDSGLDGAAERASLLRAAAVLADGGERSWHRPVDTLVEEQREQRVAQLVAEAQQMGQTEDSEPAAAVRKALRRYYLGQYEWNMDTLRFTKQKVTPEHGLYCLTIQDQAGKTHTFTCYVTRKPDGLWRAQSCSGGPVALHPVVRTLWQWIVTRNRPWLWFNGGSGIVYAADGTPKNGFLGGGEVSANGRKIARVRLRDARGELAEDTVENGLVIFSNERQMEAPLYAELYDSTGKMVWQQAVVERRV